ncbi:unnamed protein product [Mytilus coruscus]|uniref:Prolow-density lipoprotein receptor-related protein 1-like beta-propeller domain-containing protein n=1 Tax=Mytilus coruscus TaxID=42192 RepID=A0A6J8DQ26_MYTCO|nr:unnamed protein product [Mytilus coruscus]
MIASKVSTPTTLKEWIRYPSNQSAMFETVVVANSEIIGVAFDSVNNHLYWTENIGNRGNIMRCNSDGSNIRNILSESHLSVLTLDAENRLIYYGQNQRNGQLHRITVDGKEKIALINQTSSVYGIGLDHAEKRIYWMEYYTGELKSAWLDGSDVKTIVSTNVVSLNWNIDISDDYIFYSSINTIWKVTKSSGQIPSVVHTDTERILGVLFYTQNGEYKTHWLLYINKYETKCT